MPDSEYDAVIVPGGGVRSGGDLPPWMRVRLDAVVARRTAEPVILLSAGTTHKPPPLDARGYPIYESAASAAYLLSCGIAPQRLFTETCSWDTVGNAFFARLIHTDARRWRRVLVVNSAFHMDRTRRIFDWIFALDPPARPYELTYETVPNAGLAYEEITARAQHEKRGIERIAALEKRLHSLADVHRFLYAEHDCYAAGRTFTQAPDPGILASY